MERETIVHVVMENGDYIGEAVCSAPVVAFTCWKRASEVACEMESADTRKHFPDADGVFYTVEDVKLVDYGDRRDEMADQEKVTFVTADQIMATPPRQDPELEAEYRRGYRDGFIACLNEVERFLLRTKKGNAAHAKLFKFWLRTLPKWMRENTKRFVLPPGPALSVEDEP